MSAALRVLCSDHLSSMSHDLIHLCQVRRGKGGGGVEKFSELGADE